MKEWLVGVTSAGLPHPTESGFADEWGEAWSNDPQRLTCFYAPEATYTDAAMQTTVSGREGIVGFYRYMTRFIGRSRIEFEVVQVGDGHLTASWDWSGTVTGPLRLRDGHLLDLVGQHLTSSGVAVCRYDAAGLLTGHADYWDLASMLAPAGVRLVRAS